MGKEEEDEEEKEELEEKADKEKNFIDSTVGKFV